MQYYWKELLKKQIFRLSVGGLTLRKHSLFKTNILVCAIILIGFFITAVISYRSNIGFFEKDIENVSTLATEGIHSRIKSIFSRPVSVSLTMANDYLLKDFLTDESRYPDNPAYVAKMQTYLDTYRKKYHYDSVFLVSSNSGHYYHFSGLNRTLDKNNPENDWYYQFIQTDEEYALNIDNDEATDNSITVFVNCKIRDANGFVLGIVGVGFKVDSLQKLLKTYDEQFNVEATLINEKGFIEVSSVQNGHQQINFFADNSTHANMRSQMLEASEKSQAFWYSSGDHDGYIVTQYIPELKWYLVVENDVSLINGKLRQQLAWNFLIFLGVIALVLFTTTRLIRKYNAKIVELSVAHEIEYHQLLHNATAKLYENIYEMDITRNRAGGDTTRRYFEELGLSPDASYDEALDAFAKRYIKEEYIQGYLDTFRSVNVLKAYEKGINNLSYDFLCSENGIDYHWMRINTQIFFWNSDQSIRMITYRKNIDEEKKRELGLLEETQKDAMTGLYNKRATETLIMETLDNSVPDEKKHALLVLDIDRFKTINDTFGHAFGDEIISEFGTELKSQFRSDDIVGRIGGDEFCVLMKNFDHPENIREKLDRVCSRFSRKDFGNQKPFFLTTSIGVSLYPDHGTSYTELYEKADQALYYSKTHGRNCFTLYGEEASVVDASRVDQRDLETLLNNSTDGVTKFACTEGLHLLYYNSKFAELCQTPDAVLSSMSFSGWSQVHPEDRVKIQKTLDEALENKTPFTVYFRLRCHDGKYIPIRFNGWFVNELYDNRYPVFFGIYTNLSGVTSTESQSVFGNVPDQ